MQGSKHYNHLQLSISNEPLCLSVDGNGFCKFCRNYVTRPYVTYVTTTGTRYRKVSTVVPLG